MVKILIRSKILVRGVYDHDLNDFRGLRKRPDRRESRRPTNNMGSCALLPWAVRIAAYPVVASVVASRKSSGGERYILRRHLERASCTA